MATEKQARPELQKFPKPSPVIYKSKTVLKWKDRFKKYAKTSFIMKLQLARQWRRVRRATQAFLESALSVHVPWAWVHLGTPLPASRKSHHRFRLHCMQVFIVVLDLPRTELGDAVNLRGLLEVEARETGSSHTGWHLEHPWPSAAAWARTAFHLHAHHDDLSQVLGHGGHRAPGGAFSLWATHQGLCSSEVKIF